MDFSFLAYPFALIGGLLSQYLLGGTALLSKLPFASVSLEPGAPALWLAGSAVLFAIVLLDRNRTKHLARLAALCCAFALLAGIFSYTLMGRNLTAITLADVGNGTAIVLTRGRRAAVIGCGGDYDAAAQVAAVLQSQNIDALDLLFYPVPHRRRLPLPVSFWRLFRPKRLFAPKRFMSCRMARM